MVSAEQKTTLSVISSNIRYDEPTDGAHCWANRRDFLAERLGDFCGDLLATQEGKKAQIDELAERLPELTLIDSHREWIERLMYPCLFYRPEALTVVDSGDIWLSESPSLAGSRSFGSEFPRLCTWATFREGLLAINVHLDNVRADTRVHQISVLLQQIRRMHDDPTDVLLMGDFNEPPDGPVRAAINETWPNLTDPWLQLGVPEDSSHHCFGEEMDYGSRVDWILGGPSFQPLEIFLDKAVSPVGVYPSDHFILKARFGFDGQ